MHPIYGQFEQVVCGDSTQAGYMHLNTPVIFIKQTSFYPTIDLDGDHSADLMIKGSSTVSGPPSYAASGSRSVSILNPDLEIAYRDYPDMGWQERGIQPYSNGDTINSDLDSVLWKGSSDGNLNVISWSYGYGMGGETGNWPCCDAKYIAFRYFSDGDTLYGNLEIGLSTDGYLDVILYSYVLPEGLRLDLLYPDTGIYVYPSGVIHYNFTVTYAGVGDVFLFDCSGKLLFSSPFENSLTINPAAELPPGVYLVRVVLTNGNALTKKIVIGP
ncbi:MAG: T9SS type A sorting domain-containing protein [Chitinophagales bacterium]